jgi:hypothetical protein
MHISLNSNYIKLRSALGRLTGITTLTITQGTIDPYCVLASGKTWNMKEDVILSSNNIRNSISIISNLAFNKSDINKD